MSRQANGTYLQPANTAAVSGQTISSTAFNTLITDIGTEITNSVDRGGRSAMTANLPMGGNKVTGAADPTVATDLTTKNYVDTATAAFFSTGDIKFTIKTVADTGWLIFADQTIGPAGSGATYANANAQALYTLIWNNIPNGYAPVTGGRGASAAADWAGLKPMQLLTMLGRVLGIAGTGAGIPIKPLGIFGGFETHAIAVSELPAHTHSGTTGTDSPDHTHTTSVTGVLNGGGVLVGGGGSFFGPSTQNYASGGASARHAHGFTTDGGTGGGAQMSLLQPSVWLNAMIKL